MKSITIKTEMPIHQGEMLTSVVPLLVSETGANGEDILEATVCSSISGGNDEEDGMPRSLTLLRVANGKEELYGVYKLVKVIKNV